MLLKVKTDQREDETFLELTRVGGKMARVQRPFDPYFYTIDLSYEREGTVEACRKILLSTLEKTNVLRVNFSNTRTLTYSRDSFSMEDEVPYDQRVAIDKGFKVASPLPSHDAFDLEMESTRGMFPNAQIDRITAIGYTGKDFSACDTIHDAPEYEIIHRLIDRITKKRDPDLIDTYFGSYADWGWLIDRCNILGIPLRVGRDGSEPFVKIRTFKAGKKIGEDRIIDIGGRVHFDVWKEVDQDQTLFGVKNRQLKTIAAYFKIPVIKVDRAQMAKLKPEDLRAYCQSDANATYKLAEIYLRNVINLTERLAIALNMTVDRSPSHIANYLYMREFRNLDIIADKRNAERYPEFYSEERSGYQGALINLYAPGLHEEKLGHIDFKSMYPANMICFNYSPESIIWTKIDKDGRQDEWVTFKGDEITVYDKYLGTITVKVDLKHDSISRIKLKEFMAERVKIKKDPNLSENEKFSEQWAVKVIMNAIPGYNGMGYAKCGSFPVAAHITADGRWEIDHTTQYLREQGFPPIERDTDGIYYKGPDVAKEVAELIRGMIPDIFEREVIDLSTDRYDAGIFYDEKGYILRDGSKLIYHGSGLKGRHLPKVCDTALERLTWAIFKKDDVIGVLNGMDQIIKTAPMEDFLMTVKMSKEPDKYSDKNQYGKLVAIAKKYNINLRWGDELQFLKTKEYGYVPFAAVWNRNFRIDHDYYIERMANVLVRPLKVTHGYILKTVLWALKGGRIF